MKLTKVCLRRQSRVSYRQDIRSWGLRAPRSLIRVGASYCHRHPVEIFRCQCAFGINRCVLRVAECIRSTPNRVNYRRHSFYFVSCILSITLGGLLSPARCINTRERCEALGLDYRQGISRSTASLSFFLPFLFSNSQQSVLHKSKEHLLYRVCQLDVHDLGIQVAEDQLDLRQERIHGGLWGKGS